MKAVAVPLVLISPTPQNGSLPPQQNVNLELRNWAQARFWNPPKHGEFSKTMKLASEALASKKRTESDMQRLILSAISVIALAGAEQAMAESTQANTGLSADVSAIKVGRTSTDPKGIGADVSAAAHARNAARLQARGDDTDLDTDTATDASAAADVRHDAAGTRASVSAAHDAATEARANAGSVRETAQAMHDSATDVRAAAQSAREDSSTVRETAQAMRDSARDVRDQAQAVRDAVKAARQGT